MTYKELQDKLTDLKDKRREIEGEIKNTLIQMTEIELLPFKVGDNVYYNLKQGKKSEETLCVIEVDIEYNAASAASVYVRPYKKDGNLSERRFQVWIFNESYADVFRKPD